jgi:hypothetical protein
MILTGRKLYTGSVVDEDEYGAMVEWYWQGKIEALEESSVSAPLVLHKSHNEWPGIEAGHSR